MTVFFVSRHPGAVEWARRQGLQVDRWVGHLHACEVQAGDTVAGTLPMPLAAAVCARGARYLHLSVDLPPAWRGRELSAAELLETGARLEDFHVEHRAGCSTPWPSLAQPAPLRRWMLCNPLRQRFTSASLPARTPPT